MSEKNSNKRELIHPLSCSSHNYHFG